MMSEHSALLFVDLAVRIIFFQLSKCLQLIEDFDSFVGVKITYFENDLSYHFLYL